MLTTAGGGEVVQSSYVWRITDQSLLKQMKSCKVGTNFKSDVFTLHGFKWHVVPNWYFHHDDHVCTAFRYLQLWPNGDSTRKGKVLIFAVLPSLSPKFSKIALHRTYSFLESNFHHDYDYTMENSAKMHVITWPNKSLPLADIKKYDTPPGQAAEKMFLINLHGILP